MSRFALFAGLYCKTQLYVPIHLSHARTVLLADGIGRVSQSESSMFRLEEIYGLRTRRTRVEGIGMDRKEKARVRRLSRNGISAREIARRTGHTYCSVRAVLDDSGIPPAGYRKNQYTVYDSAGDVLAFGTAEECARTLGIKTNTLYGYICRPWWSKDKVVVKERF